MLSLSNTSRGKGMLGCKHSTDTQGLLVPSHQLMSERETPAIPLRMLSVRPPLVLEPGSAAGSFWFALAWTRSPASWSLHWVADGRAPGFGDPTPHSPRALCGSDSHTFQHAEDASHCTQ